jgi:hypothetical protein
VVLNRPVAVWPRVASAPRFPVTPKRPALSQATVVRPSSVLAGHFRSPAISLLPTLTGDLARYDQGLLRYPSRTTCTTVPSNGQYPRCRRTMPAWFGRLTARAPGYVRT